MELKGKTLLFLGDSITEGTGVAQAENIYLNRLGRMNGAAQVINCGVGGTTLARNRAEGWRTGAFVVRAQTLPEEAWQADVAFIFGGTNDYGVGDAPFGPEDSCSPFEVNGAVNIIIRTLRGMNPDVTIVLLSPIRRMGEDALHAVTHQPLAGYVELLRKAALRHGVHFCDWFHAGLFDPESPEDRALYIPDGLHPNDAGQGILAEYLNRFVAGIT